MSDVRANAPGLVGATPLVALDRVHRGPGRIVAKAEFLQPGHLVAFDVRLRGRAPDSPAVGADP